MKIRNDRGQATVITVVFLVVLLGMAALVLDIGSWYRADRSTQSTADAAALAGAQALPADTNNARSLAQQYANKNGGGLSAGDVTISSSPYGANDTIKVQIHRSASGVFTKLFGVNSVGVGSKATARASLM
jgi:secretion/DNA translocation related TadE-like protein